MTEPAATGWSRLDPRMLAVAPGQELVRYLPLLIAALVAGRGTEEPWWAIAVLALAAGTGILRWLTTRYKVDAQRVEVRSGLVFRQHRSVPRDRVRTVDVTAGPLHRLFGLAVLRVGTGRQQETKQQELALNAVSAPEAERLRTLLLDRSPVAEPATTAEAADGSGVVELARIDWSWLRFAPLTVFGVVAVGALLGTTWQLLEQFGVDVLDVEVVRSAVDWTTGRPTWQAIVTPAVVLIAIGTVGSLVMYVEAWWNYRLTRHPDNTLQVNRGLLTKRSVSLEERRLRGATVDEALLLRAGGGASCSAVATGSSGRGQLLPPAPPPAASRVASARQRETDPPTPAPPRPHPPALGARRRRPSAAPVLVVVAGLAVADTWLPSWPWLLAAAVLTPASALLGVDRYRNLGHTNTARQLVTREGSIVRQTVALHHVGIIGWRIEQSIFQRRAGLATVTATTAAGAGAYRVLDVDLPEGLTTARTATPGLLDPFLTGTSPS